MRSSIFASALLLSMAQADSSLSVATLLEQQMNSYGTHDTPFGAYETPHGFAHPYVDVHPLPQYHHGPEYLHH